jgi:DnaJ family protein C protein 3
MAAVNEAYEVLSNPELRARFDNGDDPNDQTQGGGGPGGFGGGFPGREHPFAHFFQQGSGGGGGGHQQQFHFRTGF